MNDQRNLMLALVICVGVLVAWQAFVIGPQMERQRQAHLAAQQQQQAETLGPDATTPRVGPGAPPSGGSAGAGPGFVPRAEALARSQRLVIDSPHVDGTLALEGARFDDLKLKDYRLTLDPASPEIEVLSPRGTDSAYYATFGWAAGGSAQTAVPGPDTVWNSVGAPRLTPDRPVTLTWENGEGLVFTRTIALDQHFMFTITDHVLNKGNQTVEIAPFGLVARYGEPPRQSFWILHEGLLGVFDNKLETSRYKEIVKEGSREFRPTAPGGWLGITDKYWMAAVIPAANEPITARFVDHQVHVREVFQTDFLGAVRTLPPGGRAEITHHFFAGAKKVKLIDAYERQLAIPRFDLAIDWGWFYFLTRPIFWLLETYNGVVGNFGVAILLLTITIKLLFFPLANKSYEAMSKMKKLQPEMVKLRERFKDDKMRQQQELMELYKKEKVNPLAGCLPVLIQIPVFFSLYKVLFVTIEMRHAPFFGWIQDLSAADPTNLFNLFGLIPWTPPTVLHIGVWPILMGVTMYLQTKMNPAPADPIQEKVFLWLPLIFTYMLATFPAGLVIYWAWNNLLSILQQYVIMRRMGVDMEWDKKFVGLRSLVRLVRNRLGGGGNGPTQGPTRQPGE